jgi:hypothetical protein
MIASGFSITEANMSGGYETVPGTGGDAVEGADPYGFTAKAGQNIFGDPAQNMMNMGAGAMNSWGADASDPNSFMSKFMNDFSGLQKGVTDATSPLNLQLQQQMKNNIGQGMAQAGGQMSNLGALRSSAMGEAAGGVVGRAATDASAQLAQQQLGMLNSLGGQAMGQRGSAMGQMMGMPGQMMGLQGQFGEPMYVQPQVAAKPGAMDWMSSIGSLLGGVGSLIPGL